MLCRCGEPVAVKRAELGYRTCLDCGDAQARKVSWVTAPLNKSNYILITNYEELKQLNPKRVGE